MALSQRAQYAVRGVFELARRRHEGPVKVHELAKAQEVPPRFLEVILNQLKQGGLVESRRGSRGGYYLARSPEAITVEEVVRFMDGPIAPVDCEGGRNGEKCALHGRCVFQSVWKEAEEALARVYQGTTFSDLVRRAEQMSAQQAFTYVI